MCACVDRVSAFVAPLVSPPLRCFLPKNRRAHCSEYVCPALRLPRTRRRARAEAQSVTASRAHIWQIRTVSVNDRYMASWRTHPSLLKSLLLLSGLLALLQWHHSGLTYRAHPAKVTAGEALTSLLPEQIPSGQACATVLTLYRPWRHFDSDSWFHGTAAPQLCERMLTNVC